MTRHFVDDLDLSSSEQLALLERARAMKANPADFRQVMAGKVLGMIFQKSSTRTRVSFEVGALQLGGHALFLSSRDIQIGRGEIISDTGQVLSRYLDMIMIRTFAHEEVRALAEASTIPVINGLDDLLHPCQALADLLTIVEHKGQARGQQLAYVGDGNNVSHSLMLAGARAGMHVRIVCPKGYEPKDDMRTRAVDAAKATASKIEVVNDLAGLEGADVVYTDVWASMGQEDAAAARKVAFADFQVDAKAMARAKADAIFLHCLPAHRGEEVSAEVIDGPASRVFDQAENRLHAQKALMAMLFEG